MATVNDARRNYYKSWQNNDHAVIFNTWGSFSIHELKKVYECFNDVQLLLKNLPTIQGRSFAELGCATGEFYRYVSHFLHQFEYTGFDISESALANARKKYPHGRFFRCGISLADTKTFIKETIGRFPDILFCRDVVLHQTKPFEFLIDLMSIPLELLILRVRTRDKGETLLDPDMSCQWNYGEWTPYMILNTDEMVDIITQNPKVRSVHVIKHPLILGGHNFRYLPKDCYYPETGTAETAVAVRMSTSDVKNPEVTIETVRELPPAYSLMDYAHKGFRKLRSRFSR